MSKDEGFPMMMKYEVRAIERLLTPRRDGAPLRFLEWGSGRSTIYFTKFLEKHGIPYLWVSIEHNPEWYAFVERGTRGNPHIVYKQISKEEKDSYVSTPRQIASQNGFDMYDIALVDGIYRNECLQEAEALAHTVLLHDAQRASYKAEGTFIAGRLLKVGPPNPLSRVEVWKYKIHEMLWKLKQLLLGSNA